MLNDPRMFANRSDAGRQLANLLSKKYSGTHPLVLGIPRGGVEVAYEVARLLEGELSMVVTKKLRRPGMGGSAIGAVAEDGSVFLQPEANDVDRETVQRIHMTQLNEIRNRVNLFRNGRPLPNMHNRIVIIADDGIFTGSTVIPAIKLCRSRKASRVIVAAPVSAKRYLSAIGSLADEVIVIKQSDDLQALSQVYGDVRALSDDEVVSKLNQFEGFFRRKQASWPANRIAS